MKESPLPPLSCFSSLGTITPMHRLRILCAAALLCLALHAANRDPAQFENEIRAYEASDRTNPPPKDAVLFVGSSSIRLWSNLAESFPQFTTIGRGFGGSHLPDAIAFADRIIIPYRPAKIVLYAGENDIARGDSPEDVFEAFKKLVTKIHTALPNTSICYLAIKPAPIRWHLSPQERRANDLIRRYCTRHKNLKFVNTWPATLNKDAQPDPALYKPDNLHLNEAGYQRWVPIIAHALNN
jgi:lysophospholipase L1-like esterase